MIEGAFTGAAREGREIGDLGVRMHGLDCCAGVAVSKAQDGLGVAHGLDVDVLFEAFSYCGEAAAPGELGGDVVIFGQIVFGEAGLHVGVSVVLEFWAEALGAGEVDDEIQLRGVFGIRVRDRGWVVANEGGAVRQGLLGNVETDGGCVAVGD